VIIFSAFLSLSCYGSLLPHPSKKKTKGHFGNTVAASDTARCMEQVRICYTADHDLLDLINIMSAYFYVFYSTTDVF
jgi:hypothetical protein